MEQRKQWRIGVMRCWSIGVMGEHVCHWARTGLGSHLDASEMRP
jgi:hypothetical protein